jgi:large subunit ribosomal protein L23
MHQVIIKPVITEKMTAAGEKFNRYGFIVNRKSSKDQIKRAIESSYDVKVESVNTMIYAGRAVSKYSKTGMMRGHTDMFKKAVVTLKDGHTIDLFANL